MTPYHAIRIAVWIILIITAIIIDRKKSNGKNIKLLIIVITAVIIVFDIIPIENLFIKFKSPEKVFWYVTGDKAECVVEGNDSVLVIGESNTDILKRKEDGFVVDNKAYKFILTQYSNEVLIQVGKKKESSDIYVFVTPNNETESMPTDTFGSCYRKVSYDKSGQSVYVAYIGCSVDGYCLNINGRRIKLEK